MNHKQTKTNDVPQDPAVSPLSFYGLGIVPKILETIIRLGFKNATPIQHKAIPIALEHKDFIG
ncbi:MAG TPA: hypothetical protein PKV41_02005, partial [Candidatus Omnitrophota bacterium]|nr:hypothetical protein [Candidatus Omnitrophota bacterium]